MKFASALMSHKYLTLDGIRGVAALLIAVRHTGDYFGGRFFIESHLAVDLFFVLSGFVIAEAYDQRLRTGMSAMEFMRIRLIRLYPLYLLGLLLGVAHTAGWMLFGNYQGGWAVSDLMAVTAFSVLMLPSLSSPDYLYPINPPSWSLFFELFSNALYAVFFPLLTAARLLVAVIFSAILLGVFTYKTGNLDVGFYWENFFMGAPRVIYSFGAGLLIHRFTKTRPRRGAACNLPSWLLLLAVFAVLCFTPPAQARPWFEIVAVIILLPGIVYLASASEPRTAMAAKCYALLGSTSYAIYVIHVPLSRWIETAFRRAAALDIARLAPFSGLVMLCFLILFCWWIDRVYDLPLRRLATNYFARSSRA